MHINIGTTHISSNTLLPSAYKARRTGIHSVPGAVLHHHHQICCWNHITFLAGSRTHGCVSTLPSGRVFTQYTKLICRDANETMMDEWSSIYTDEAFADFNFWTELQFWPWTLIWRMICIQASGNVRYFIVIFCCIDLLHAAWNAWLEKWVINL